MGNSLLLEKQLNEKVIAITIKKILKRIWIPLDFKKLVLLFSLLTPLIVNGQCLLDIYSAGISADSIGYDLDKVAEIASTVGTGVRFGRVIFCPRKSLEIIPTLRLRWVKFSDTKKQSNLSGIEESQLLFSTGAEVRKYYKNKWEWVGDMELRQDIAFMYNSTARIVSSKKFLNLKTMAGIRRYVYNKDRHDFTAKLKLGPLIPIGALGDAGIGIIWGLSGEYLFKIGKKSTLLFDLYWDHYSQEYKNLPVSRSELGMMANLLFRF